MLIQYEDPSQIVLQISPQNLDGSPKDALSNAEVRVYHVVSGAEVEDLVTTSLSYISGSYVWRYVWEPVSLPQGHYIIEFNLLDVDSVQGVFLEDIIIEKRSPSVVDIDEELSDNHGDGSWETSPSAGAPSIIPGNGA